MAMRMEMGRHVLIGDEPPTYGGDDLGPTPFQLLCAALGECTAMWVRWHARRQLWPLTAIAVDVTHERRIVEGRIDKTDTFHRVIHLTGEDLTAEQRQSLLDHASGCPVHRALTAGSVVTTAAYAAGSTKDPA